MEEMLLYTAEMKLPIGTGIEVKKSRVVELVSFLGLETCCKTVIGSATKRGVSGGQVRYAFDTLGIGNPDISL